MCNSLSERERNLSCSCLKAACDMFNPPLGDVVDRINAMFPNLNAEDWDEFRECYLQTTNAMARETPYYQGFSAAEKAAVEERLARRCGLCGARVVRSFTETSVFDLLKRAKNQAAPVTTLRYANSTLLSANA